MEFLDLPYLACIAMHLIHILAAFTDEQTLVAFPPNSGCSRFMTREMSQWMNGETINKHPGLVEHEAH